LVFKLSIYNVAYDVVSSGLAILQPLYSYLSPDNNSETSVKDSSLIVFHYITLLTIKSFKTRNIGAVVNIADDALLI